MCLETTKWTQTPDSTVRIFEDANLKLRSVETAQKPPLNANVHCIHATNEGETFSRWTFEDAQGDQHRLYVAESSPLVVPPLDSLHALTFAYDDWFFAPPMNYIELRGASGALEAAYAHAGAPEGLRLPVELSASARGEVECEGSNMCIPLWYSYRTKMVWRDATPFDLASFEIVEPERGYRLQTGRTAQQAEGINSPCTDAYIASAEMAVVRTEALP
jgi:hypothetical protein